MNETVARPQFSSEVMRQGPGIRKAHMTSLVRVLNKEHGVKQLNILEVGSWAGASTITWAMAIKDLGLTGSVHCVDIWEPYFDLRANNAAIYQAMNSAADHGAIFQEFSRNISAAGVENIVHPTKGNSRDVLPGLAAESYHIIFIDGSHLYDDVCNDIIQARRLVVDGGIICGDDYELKIGLVNEATHRAALANSIDFVKDPSTGISYHPGVSQAIADIFDEVSVWDGLWAVRRNGPNFEKIDLSGYESGIPEHLRLGEEALLTERVRSELGFNIIRSRGKYIGCRHSLGTVDFSIPLDTLLQSYSRSDLIVATSLEEVSLRICEIKIAELNASEQSAPTIERLESQFGFNIIKYGARFIACRQSLGTVDFSIPLDTLLQSSSPSDLIVATSLEEASLRICETKIAELCASGTTAPAAELLESHFGFNIIKRGAQFVGCRESLGTVDFSIPLDTLPQSYSPSDLIVATSLEEVSLRICEIKIAELNASEQSAPTIERLESQFGFNIIKYGARFIACRQSLGTVDFSIPLDTLLQSSSPSDLIVAMSLEEVSRRICETKIAELNALERSAPAVELLESHFGFNIIKYGAQFVGCRQSLGTVDFSVPPDALLRSYSPSDLIVAPSLKEVSLRICETKIAELNAHKQSAPTIELLESHFGFNIVKHGARFIGCRQSLGTVDFSMPPEALLRSYSPSDLIVATSLKEVSLRICETKIAELSTSKQSAPAIELLDSHFGFNILKYGAQFIGCRQLIGEIAIARPLDTLLQGFSSEDFFVEQTREEVLLRICEIEKERLARVIAEGLDVNSSPETDFSQDSQRPFFHGHH
ncbi:MAG: class I SAM-dependent methyltransferase [Acidobacteria bacterium]|nr:class I SAM-dependent methyltransferase [Acidobacteriota bacterium]